MNPLLQALMGAYVPGEMHDRFMAGINDHPPTIDDMYDTATGEMPTNFDITSLTPEQQGMIRVTAGGGGGAPHGYGAGAGYGQLNPNDVNQNGSMNGGMVRSSKSWQPPMWSGGAPAAEEPVTMPQVDVVPGYSLRGKYPEPGARAGWLDDGRQVTPAQYSQANGKGAAFDRMNQQAGPLFPTQDGNPVPNEIQQMLSAQGGGGAPWGGLGPQQPGGGNSLAQALTGGMPQGDDGFNQYLPGMPSEAERNQNVMLNARARKESRLARMGEVSPTMLGMFDQAMEGGGQGGMNPMMARLFGGPQGFNTALQNQGLMDRQMLAMGPQEIEAQARLIQAQGDSKFKDYLMSEAGQRLALQRQGIKVPSVPGSREWLIDIATNAPDYATFETIVSANAPEAVAQARNIWLEIKMQDPTAPPAPPSGLGQAWGEISNSLPPTPPQLKRYPSNIGRM
jgi:hypothetical protein